MNLQVDPRFLRRLLGVVAALSLCLLAGLGAASAAPATVDPAGGTAVLGVFDGATEKAINGATIYIMNEKGTEKVDVTQTNGLGEAAVQLPAGTYQVWVEARGYQSGGIKQLVIRNGQETAHKIVLWAEARPTLSGARR